jgi:protein-tyrosine-phosphatase
MSELHQRAAVFAALSDPGRLRIVDLLAVGDLSPTEVQLALGMPSNLAAHHLRVLESAGILSRSRSEFDGRRNYVRLVPGAFDTLAPGPRRVAGRVVFVCTANSARSRLAEALWLRSSSSIPAVSAGTHPADAVNPGALRAAARHELNLTTAQPRSVAEVVHDGDFVVSVCDRAHEELGGLDDAHWSIPDPVRIGTDEAFDAALDDLGQRIAEVSTRLSA